MKKVVSVAFAAMMALSTACFAAGDGNVLNKLQKPAENMISMLGKTPVEYELVIKDFAAEAKKNFTAEAYKNVKKAAAEKFGSMKEFKFVAFQRMDQADIVAYLGAFTKEKVVNMLFFFDKTGKIINFQFAPMQAQPAKKAEK